MIERVEVRRNEQVLDMTHDAPLQIADGDRDLRIVARLLSFADSASNTYRYRLAGYDPDWVEVGPAGERLFSRLAPGSYRLEVQAGRPTMCGRGCRAWNSAYSRHGGAACPACWCWRRSGCC